ncbi:ABC transporter G family member 5-like isoform X2 [Ananas comosus]|uniref:ABC transporter G family member 5-like isoform X2 n=1 Tax=Ananas comosus TaxID=4615 RepID=A0A6P5EV00_ANACO|nr:ABC transporter G family member 5-like isoform X2 [Ananas comosus]
MKKQGCEIEAKGINYYIKVPKRSHPLKIWSRDAEEDPNTNIATSIQCHGQANSSSSSSSSKLYGVRQVLKNVEFVARPREILAIVGPSGAGKSTLLEVLAGRLAPPSPPPLVLVNGRRVEKSEFRRMSGYVTQRDTLFPLLTVRETLLFSARLRVAAGCCGSGVGGRVEAVLQELGLDAVADVRVRDVSGAKRRVSIGVDLVHDPAVLLLDEPTSGLDSASALQVVEALRATAAARGRTVILSIHQPGFRIAKQFGSLLLLADGAALHRGSPDALLARLRSLGLALPLGVDVVEFAIDSIPSLQKHHHHHQLLQLSEKFDRCTLQHLFNDNNDCSPPSPSTTTTTTNRCNYANSRGREVGVLAHRFCKNVWRTRQLFTCRAAAMLVSGLALGSIFYGLRPDQVVERVGFFAFVLTFLLSSTTEALPIFLQEREIVMKETFGGAYRLSSYVLANSLVFVHFLLVIWLVLYTANSVVVCFSAAAPNFIVGNSVISGAMGSFFLFSGYFIAERAMPRCWVFMHYVSLFKYPFEAFLVNELGGRGRCVVVEGNGGGCVVRGEDVLRGEGLGEELRWRNVGAMVGFIVLYRFFAYLILWLRCRCAQNGGLSGQK